MDVKSVSYVLPTWCVDPAPVIESRCQHVADLASLHGLIARAGLAVYVSAAALRAAFSDA